jgi:hypothetical protein
MRFVISVLIVCVAIYFAVSDTLTHVRLAALQHRCEAR